VREVWAWPDGGVPCLTFLITYLLQNIKNKYYTIEIVCTISIMNNTHTIKNKEEMTVLFMFSSFRLLGHSLKVKYDFSLLPGHL
jgi:hypothetical protein